MPVTTSEFVPADLDATCFENIEPLFLALLDRSVESAEALDLWLVDRSELESAYSEAQARLYINMTCKTEDEQVQGAYTRFIEDVQPRAKPLGFGLDKKQVELVEKFGDGERMERYLVLHRDTRAEVELYRDENVPLETELSKLSQKFDQITGVMMVEFEGESRTLPQMGLYQESTDRAQREAAWRAVADRRLEDADAIEDVFDEMITLRDQVAHNAGFENYIGYAFESMHRFDYTPADCSVFHDACEKHVVPMLRELDEQRRESLGVQTLRPWDLLVDRLGRNPLRPFSGGTDLVTKTRHAFAGLDSELDSMFKTLGDGSTSQGVDGGAMLDLDTRKGKAPGGYQYMLDRTGTPFIFMNAAGLHRDLETMVHEAGHAFHSMFCEDEPLLHYRHSPIEFAEVASMSMELLSMPYWGGAQGFYADENDLSRACRQQIESSILLLPWIATIDAFQHWIYANPDHTRDERAAQWQSLDERFGRGVSWDGLENYSLRSWQRQGHLFGAPFYYIEYGIAQLGALGLWVRSLEEGQDVAVKAYKKTLSLGGSRPLPELFETAGLKFDFGADTVGHLVDRVRSELAKLPE